MLGASTAIPPGASKEHDPLLVTSGMNNPLQCKYEVGEPRERSVTPEYCFDTMDSHCVHCGNSTEYSVKSLRNLFLLNSTQEGPTKLKSGSTNIERLPECKCKEHAKE
uniref:Uncharacterized protein n=1 Tax=Anopheles culicifacies TaxID=139723 RepID=A0A182LXQ2_9DIPT